MSPGRASIRASGRPGHLSPEVPRRILDPVVRRGFAGVDEWTRMGCTSVSGVRGTGDVSRETSPRGIREAMNAFPGNQFGRVPRVVGASQRFSFLLGPAAGKLLGVGRERRCHGGILVLQRVQLRPIDRRLGVRVGGGSFACPRSAVKPPVPHGCLSVGCGSSYGPARLVPTTRRRRLSGHVILQFSR